MENPDCTPGVDLNRCYPEFPPRTYPKQRDGRELYLERHFIGRLEAKLARATTPHKRERYAKRIINARARLLAHVLAKE